MVFKSTKIQHAVVIESQSNISIHLFDGALEFVHVAFKKREVREKEILEAVVLLRVGGQHEDNSDGNLLLPSHTKAWSTTFIRHVEALLNWPDQDRADIESASENTTALKSNMYAYTFQLTYYHSKLVRALLWFPLWRVFLLLMHQVNTFTAADFLKETWAYLPGKEKFQSSPFKK